MCDCVCTSCIGSSHCGSCTGGERGKELRGGIYTRCDCKLRNGIQDDCLRVSCKRGGSPANEKSERSMQQRTKDENMMDMGDYSEQRSNGLDLSNQQAATMRSHNNGLGDGLQNYNQMPPNNMGGMPFQGNPGYQQGQALLNAMFSQNSQMNSFPHPTNAISNYFTPTNQPTPFNFPMQPYNQSNQLDLNTMLNQTQFKEPSDSMHMYYQGKAQQINQLSDQLIKNQPKDIQNNNYGQGDSNSSNNNLNNNNRLNTDSTNTNDNNQSSNINCIPFNPSTFGSMVINPAGNMIQPPISVPLINNSGPNGFGNWNSNTTDTPFYPCMTVVLNLSGKNKKRIT